MTLSESIVELVEARGNGWSVDVAMLGTVGEGDVHAVTVYCPQHPARRELIHGTHVAIMELVKATHMAKYPPSVVFV